MKNYKEDFITENNYIYLNSASTSFICKKAYKELINYYKDLGSNAGRGIDSLGFQVTNQIEKTRLKVAKFLGAKNKEIVFTRGATESLNLVATSFAESVVSENDEIIVSIAEHHSNFVPWQELAQRKKAKLIVLNLKNNSLDLEKLKANINSKTKIVAINHTSNVIGSRNDLDTISKITHEHDAYLVVDGAQGIIHEKIDVKKLDLDFYALSAHKMYGPKGVGILYGKNELLEQMKPITFGGEMVDVVELNKTTYKPSPSKFEAGTLMIPEIMALGGAIDYINEIGLDNINSHIKELRKYTIKKLNEKYSNIIFYNEHEIDSNLITFNIKDIHSHDVADVLDKNKIIVRAGHHCCEPLTNYLNVSSTIRISFGIYNTIDDCDKLIDALGKVGNYLDVLF